MKLPIPKYVVLFQMEEDDRWRIYSAVSNLDEAREDEDIARTLGIVDAEQIIILKAEIIDACSTL